MLWTLHKKKLISHKKWNWKHNSKERGEDYAIPPTNSAKCRNCYKARLARISQVGKNWKVKVACCIQSGIMQVQYSKTCCKTRLLHLEHRSFLLSDHSPVKLLESAERSRLGKWLIFSHPFLNFIKLKFSLLGRIKS